MTFSAPLAYLQWDPERIAFTIPGIDWPVAWYGVLFACGFLIGYLVLAHIFERMIAAQEPLLTKKQRRGRSIDLADQVVWYVVPGTVIGARLGHVFLYNWPAFREHPLDILKVWEGGLASHGGTVGVMLALWLFYRSAKGSYPTLTLLGVWDRVAIPAAFIAFCIRVGNFINQEILGTATLVPWAVVFRHPADGSHALPRHPAQLYEAACYLLTFATLYMLWRKKGENYPSGKLTGILFLMVFGSRFLIEFVKAPLGTYLAPDAVLQMGQYLSIPCLLFGLALVVRTPKVSAEIRLP